MSIMDEEFFMPGQVPDLSYADSALLEIMDLPEPREVDVNIAIEQVLTRQAQRLTWGIKKYIVREKPDLAEYVWQDHFRPHRKSAVEAFGLTNHTDEAFSWNEDA